MIVEDNITSVTCEWHEDYIASYLDGRLELVSVKHREPDSGPWSFSELCKSGGLIHLFDRWRVVSEIAICRISTNAGLKPGEDEARQLAEVCSKAKAGVDGIDGQLDKYAAKITKLIHDRNAKQSDAATLRDGEASGSSRARRKKDSSSQPTLPEHSEQSRILEAEVKRFLIKLQIEYSLPGRAHIRSHNIVNLMKPALEHLGRSTEEAEAYYDSIVCLVEEANSDNNGQAKSLSAYLANPDRLARDQIIRDTVGRRTLTRVDLMACLITDTEQAVRLSMPPPETTTVVQVAGSSRLVRKLAAGGIGPTAISSAQRLRGTWLAAWAELRTGLPGDAAELADLQTRVLQIASQVEGEVRSGDNYGSEMNRRLAEALKPNALGRRLPIALDPLHLLGLAYELCDECHIWFSDPQLVNGDV